ncbi:MAG: hypothetical protein ACYDAS_01120 [Patescibacteria group bacterium]
MDLRQFYYDKYKNDFSLYEEFIRKFSYSSDVDSFLTLDLKTFDEYCDDRNLPLYDYISTSLYELLKTQVNPELKFLYNIIDKDFIEFLYSQKGKDFLFYEGLKNKKGEEVSVKKDALMSEENYENLDFSPYILDQRFFYFIDHDENVGRIKYLKEVKNLFIIRKFLEYGGSFAYLNNADDDLFIKKLWIPLREGVFKLSDKNLVTLSISRYEDIFDFNLDLNVEL